MDKTIIGDAITVSTPKSVIAITMFPVINWIFTYLNLDIGLVVALFIIMGTDFIFAWYKNRMLGISFSKDKLIEGLYKKVMMFLFLLVVGLVVANIISFAPELADAFKMRTYANAVGIYLMIVELMSIMDNLIKAKEKGEVDLFTYGVIYMRRFVIDKLVMIFTLNKK